MKIKYIFLFLVILSIFSITSFSQTTFEPIGQPTIQQAEDQSTVSWLSLVNETCKTCLEGEKTKFDISITNTAGKEFIVRSAALVDSSGIVFASGNINLILPASEIKYFSLDSVLPPPTRGKTLYYTLCLSLSVDGSTTQSCENTVRRMVIQSNIETNLLIIYIILSIILVVNTVFFLLFLRKIEKKSR